MRTKWFIDSIPLDPMIAPMVLFFQKNGIRTTQSCEGGRGRHLYGRPTISFEAVRLKDIDRVYKLLRDNGLDTSLEVGLMTGPFARKDKIHRYGFAHWIWTNEGKDGERNLYKTHVYDRVIEMVPMDEIKDITMNIDEWCKLSRPKIG